MQPTHVICHYAEIGTKGKNRRYFENKLRENVKAGLKVRCPDSYEYIRRIHGRILVKLSEQGQEGQEKIADVLKNIFGVAYFVFARKSKQQMSALKKDALDVLSQLSFDSFRITARKSGAAFPFSRQHIHEIIGAHIVEHRGKKVSLTRPEVTCYIDLVQKSAFLYTARISGPGGLPVGVSGKVVAMLSGGIDSPVASYYAMKRGAYVIFIHFHSVPYTNRASIEKVREMIQTLNKFQTRAKLYLVELARIQQQIMSKTDPRLRIILYRRFMLRIAEAIARMERAHAIVTGESLGQVSSQTLENMEVIGDVTPMPILRPLIGFDKQEIVNQAKEIETYQISIQPDQDCCSLFVPKHPATKARVEDVAQAEASLDIGGLVGTAVDGAATEMVH